LRQAVRIDLYRARDKFFADHRDGQGKITCAVTKERILPQDGSQFEGHPVPMLKLWIDKIGF